VNEIKKAALTEEIIHRCIIWAVCQVFRTWNVV